jgi:hypothetical protein
VTEISLFRLYALRAAYLLIAGGTAVTIWPLLVSHPPGWPLMNGVVCSLLAAMSVIAALGLRYPLPMLPILLFELTWKSIWLVAVALPLWRAGALDAATTQTIRECLLAAILIPAIPWRYVVSRYLKTPGDRWSPNRAMTASSGDREHLIL